MNWLNSLPMSSKLREGLNASEITVFVAVQYALLSMAAHAGLLRAGEY